MLRRSAAGIAALNARFYAGVWAQIGEEKARRKTMYTNGTTVQREKVQFEPNVPVRLALKYAQPKIGMSKSGEYALFTTSDNRVMFLTLDEARAITEAGLRPGQEFDLTLRCSGKARVYYVSLPAGAAPAYGAQRDGTYAVPAAAPQPAAAAESDLEYELRRSVELRTEIAERKRKRAAGDAQSVAAPVATPAATPARFASDEDTTARNGRGESWLHLTNALAKELVGVYADVLAWSREEHGADVSAESVRCLVTSAFIETRRGAR
jgi:hypothetical protein